MAKNKGKPITLERLARMIKRGFDDTPTKKDLKYLATKEDLAQVRQAMATKQEFGLLRQEMKTGFKKVNQRIDKLYILIDGFVRLHEKLDLELTSLKAQVERLEGRIAQLETSITS